MKKGMKRLVSGLLAIAMVLATFGVNTKTASAEERTMQNYVYDGYEVVFDVTDAWDGAFNAEVKIANTGDAEICDWALTFEFAHEIQNLWNATVVEHTGNTYVIKNADWNANINPGEGVVFGMTVLCDGDIAFPENFSFVMEEESVTTQNYSAEFTLYSDWGTGCNGAIILSNLTDESIENWQLEFDYDREIVDIANAVIVSHEQGHYVIENAEYNADIAANSSVHISIVAGEGAADERPENFTMQQTVVGDESTGTGEGDEKPEVTDKPEYVGKAIFEFDREYTNEWGNFEVCFGLKDEEGNPLTDINCVLSVEGNAVIKSPQIADDYGQIQEIITDEEGKAKFFIISEGHGDSIIKLKIETENGDIIEKEIYCIDPVKEVPNTPKVSVLHESDNIDLNWTYQADAEEYFIERKVDDGTYQEYGNTVTTSFSDTEIKSGHTYSYRVYAKNYLGYSEKTEEFCVAHVTPMENLGELIVDQMDVYTGESTTLTFQISPRYSLLPGQSIDLVVYDGNEIVGKTVLLDDGAVSNGDNIWRDGVFTGQITIMEDVEKELLFHATAEISFCGKKQMISSANDVRVNVFDYLTEEVAMDFVNILEKSEEILSSSMESNNEENAVQIVLEYLRSLDNVVEAGISEECRSIWFLTECGIMGTLPIASEGTMGRSALTLDSFVDGTQTSNLSYIDIVSYMEMNGYDSKLVEAGSVKLNSFRSLSGNDFIIINCHGNLANNVPYIFTDEPATISNMSENGNDLRAKRLIVTVNEGKLVYGVMPDYIATYNDNLQDTVIFLMSCHGLNGGTMWGAFSSCGAKSLVGFYGSVSVEYATNVLNKFLEGVFEHALTVGMAFDYARNVYGYTDEQYGGYSGLCGARDYELSGLKLLKNGDFERNYDGWEHSGDAKIVTNLGTLTPQSGQKMALISTGLGAVSDSSSIISQKFYIPSQSKTLSVSYNVVSEEPMEYVGSSYDDRFECVVQMISGEKVVAQESVNSSEWKFIGDIGFYGGDNTAYMTDWKQVDFDVSQYGNQEVTLRFRVWDVGDSAYDTAVLIDDISIDGMHDCVAGEITKKGDFVWPIESTQITLPYGDVLGLSGETHCGIDIQGTSGNQIFAATSGTVVAVETQSGYGKVVYINSIAGDIQTRYGHLSSVKVTTGDKVLAGQIIGTIGNSGDTEGGLVLHFEVLKAASGQTCSVDGTNSNHVNPLDYLTYIVPADLSYLSMPVAVGVVPGDVLGAYANKAVSAEQRYVQNLDLKEGEAYLNKLLYAIKGPHLSKMDLEIANSSINLNSQGREINSQVVVDIEDYLDYYFPEVRKVPSYPSSQLKLNQNNETVAKVRTRLKELNYLDNYNATLDEKSVFDAGMLKAVNDFKDINGLAVVGDNYGKIGEQMWSLLFSDNAKSYDSKVLEYMGRIDDLEALYPNWAFETFEVGLSLGKMTDEQYWILNPCPKAYDDSGYQEKDESVILQRYKKIREKYSSRRDEQEYPNSKLRTEYLIDGKFFLTTYEGMEYYLNPLVYLGGDSLFAFANQAAGGKEYSIESLVSMFEGTYFDESNGDYVKWFYEIALRYDVNPYVLASKALVETGASNPNINNKLLTGYTHEDGTVVYNYFGIGATDGDATVNGANRAKKEGWTTPELAIEGGAKFISSSYINRNQDTYYTMRFDIPGYLNGLGWSHQYASSISDAYSKGSVMGRNSKQYLIDYDMVFKIPVYK